MKQYYTMDKIELGMAFANELNEPIPDNLDHKLDHKEIFMMLWNKCKTFGLFNIFDLLNSQGSDFWRDAVSLMYGIGKGSNQIGIMFSVNVQLWACIFQIMEFANPDQKALFLPGLTQGKLIGAHAISENVAGSDVFNLRSDYEEVHDGYLLNGYKNYVTNAPYADLYLLYARRKGTNRFNEVSCFLIQKDAPGLSTGEMIPKMGMELSPMSSIYLNQCWIDKNSMLGKENQGVFIFNRTMVYERPLLLAFQVGMMERQLKKNVQYCKKRKQSGVSIATHQSVSNRLADMKVNLEACKLFLWNIIDQIAGGKNDYAASSIAKLFISECLVKNSMMAMRNYGTLGYLVEGQAEQHLRDSLGSLFYSGTSDIQRNIIAKLL